MDSDSQLLPAPRQQQQLQDAHIQPGELLRPPTASTSGPPGLLGLPENSLVTDSSNRRPVTNASQDVQTATGLTANLACEPRLKNSVSHSHLQLRFHDQQRHSHSSRPTHMRTHILRSYQSSSDLSTNKKERLLPRSAGSSNVLRRAPDKKPQAQDTTKSGPRTGNTKKGEYVNGLKEDDGIPQWRKLLVASKSARKHGRGEIDIFEALQSTQTSRKASTSTLREKGHSSNYRPQKEVGKRYIYGGIGGNGKVSFRYVCECMPAYNGHLHAPHLRFAPTRLDMQLAPGCPNIKQLLEFIKLTICHEMYHIVQIHEEFTGGFRFKGPFTI